MSNLLITILGFIAASLTTASTLPQAIETISSRKTNGISLLMYILFVIGAGLWSFYGFFLNNYIILIANVITFFFSSITLCFKISNVVTGKEPFFNSSKKSGTNDSPKL
jgi:MtN3 and saliva related transmembrane protein